MTAMMAAQTVAKNTKLLNPGAQAYMHLNPGGLAKSGIRVNVGKNIEEREGDIYAAQGSWLLPGGTASEYAVRFTQNSGDTLHGNSLLNWHTLSASREVWLEVSIAVENANVTVEIRENARPANVISFVVTLNADGAPI